VKSVDDTNWTWFHLPDAPDYDPHAPTVSEGYGASIEGWLALVPGTRVTIHGRNYAEYRVSHSHFHVGHPAEQGGMHIYLEDA
jgi:hypothetical protein